MTLYRKEDIYCESMRNVLWSREQVKAAVQEHRFWDLASVEDPEALAALVGRANASLWLYTEFVNAAKHPYSHEFHGPYVLDSQETLIVRHYYDLKPVQVWPWSAKLPFEEVYTLEVYEGINWGFSFFNHTESSSVAPQHLRRFSIALDRPTEYLESIEDIEGLVRACTTALAAANEYVADYSEKDWHRKLLELHFYYLKPFKDRLGVNWRPPKALYEFIEQTELDDTYDQFLKLIGRLYQQVSREEGVRLLTNHFIDNIYKNRTKYSSKLNF